MKKEVFSILSCVEDINKKNRQYFILCLSKECIECRVFGSYGPGQFDFSKFYI